jgi:hypothetical protein
MGYASSQKNTNRLLVMSGVHFGIRNAPRWDKTETEEGKQQQKHFNWEWWPLIHLPSAWFRQMTNHPYPEIGWWW